MDDDEDFMALFFTECEENLADLQTGLDKLQEGDRDPETVNAAFRAVHSVKGGAAAFGFEDVVTFAHGFETVMDKVRSGAMDLSTDICDVLLRAADVMSGLVEAVKTGSEGPTARAASVSGQLAALVDGGGSGAAAPDPAPEPATPKAAPQEASPAPVAAAPPPPEMEFELEPEPIVVTVRVAPGPDFLLAGLDPALMIRAARAHNLISVAVEGEVPPIGEYAPGTCPLSWRLEFEPDDPIGELETFFTTYGYIAEITFTPSVAEVAAAQAARQQAMAAPPPPPAAPVDSAPDAAAPVDAPEVEAQPAPPAPAAEDASHAAEPAPTPAEAAPTPAGTARPAEAREPAAPPPRAAEPKAEGPAAAKTPPATARSLRVDLERVDRLVNLVGEVLIAQAAVAQGIGAPGETEMTEIRPLIEALSRQTRELQESVMAIRAQPMRSVFSRVPRVVRDLADTLGKDARLVVIGEDVEVDTTVIEELNEPLMHMIRNAMDHGLEMPDERIAAGKPRTGTLTLAAEHRGGRVRITLSDDGRGINREVVLAKARSKGLVAEDEELDIAAIEQLIFHPGFSTAATISSVSGRGVGMDVVLRKIQMLGGRCAVAGTPGKGTVFTITLPLTLAVMEGMAVKVADQQFILPVSSLVEAITVDPAAIAQNPDRSRILKLRGDLLPLLSLRSALSLPDAEPGPATAVVVDTETSGHVVVLVDALLGQRQVVLKSLEGNVGRIEGVGGATVMGDGRVALVLDVAALFCLGPQSAPELERMH